LVELAVFGVEVNPESYQCLLVGPVAGFGHR
jgi:hypothetical protein